MSRATPHFNLPISWSRLDRVRGEPLRRNQRSAWVIEREEPVTPVLNSSSQRAVYWTLQVTKDEKYVERRQHQFVAYTTEKGKKDSFFLGQFARLRFPAV